MQVYQLKVNRDVCIGCNICTISCPLNFKQLKEKGYLTKENAVVLVKNGTAYDIYVEGRDINCDGCGVCLKYCPVSAIELHLVEVK